MAVTTITSTSFYNADADDAGDILFVPEDHIMTNNGYTIGFFAGSTDTTALIAGTLISDGAAILGNPVNDTTQSVSILSTGYVFGSGTGIVIQPDIALISNAGTIEAFGRGISVSVAVEDLVVNNTGTLLSGSEGIFSEASIFSEISNSGLISADQYGVRLRDDGVVSNTGTLQATASNGTAVYFNGSIGEEMRLVNTGVITGPNYSVYGEGEVDKIENSGTLQGRVKLLGNNDVLTNTGDIVGSVQLDGGQDILVNSGTITGDIFGGADGDMLRGSGDFGGVINLGDGADTFRAVGGATVGGDIVAGTGNDTVYGTRFDDVILGGDDNDIIRGRGGADELYGNADTDTLRGNDGNDFIYGGTEDDFIYGGDGADFIDGGEGQEFIFGGTGVDVFDFNSAADTGLTNTTRDSIRDFEVGVDQVDLSDWIFREFEFIGTSSFDGAGDAQIRLRIVNGSTFVRIDEDGDGIQDAQIFFRNVTTMTEADFIL